MVESVGNSGIREGTQNPKRLKGFKFDELQKNNAKLAEFFKSKGIVPQNDYILSSDIIDKLDADGDGKINGKEIKDAGFKGNFWKKENSNAAKLINQMIKDLPDGNYTIDKGNGRSEVVNQNGELQYATEIVDENTVNYFDAQNNKTKSVTTNGQTVTTDEFAGNTRSKQTVEVKNFGTTITEFAEDGVTPNTISYSGEKLVASKNGVIKEEFSNKDGKQFVTTTDIDNKTTEFEIINGERIEIKPEKKVEEQTQDNTKTQVDAKSPQEGAAKNTEPTEYTVPNGKNFTTLIKESLKGQGIENPTKEQIDAEIARFKELNPGAVKTTKKGVEYLLAGAKVKIAGGLKNNPVAEDNKVYYGGELDEVVVVAKAKKKTTKSTQKTGKQENSAPAPNTARNSNVLHLKGADPKTGKLNGKNYTPAKGYGLLKYNEQLKGYERYNGTYNGKYYKDGKPASIATTRQVKYDGEQTASYRVYNTYHYKQGSLTPKYADPTYDSNVQIKIGNRNFEMRYGDSSGYQHADFKDFVENFVDANTGAIRAKNYFTNTYYLISGNTKLPITIDRETKALMVTIGNKQYDMNDIMTGKVRLK